jgi:hypothetical protein
MGARRKKHVSHPYEAIPVEEWEKAQEPTPAEQAAAAFEKAGNTAQLMKYALFAVLIFAVIREQSK